LWKILVRGTIIEYQRGEALPYLWLDDILYVKTILAIDVDCSLLVSKGGSSVGVSLCAAILCIGCTEMGGGRAAVCKVFRNWR